LAFSYSCKLKQPTLLEKEEEKNGNQLNSLPKAVASYQERFRLVGIELYGRTATFHRLLHVSGASIEEEAELKIKTQQQQQQQQQ